MKKLSCGTPAKLNMPVEVIDSTGGHKRGTVTTITGIDGMVVNKSGHKIDLFRWRSIVDCNGWLQNVQSLKCLSK